MPKPEPAKPHPHGPPHNPYLRELVAKKRCSFPPPKREVAIQGFRGWHERGYLPHRDEPGLVQFVTFRLTDSFPMALRSEWEHLWRIEDERERRIQLETYLDKGRGNCHLRRVDIAEIVEGALRFFHGKRYDLRAWVIMPNHVHVLFQTGTTPMAEIIASWKKHTALKSNQILGRCGAFWEADYWDTYMRNSAHESKTVRYIENNPLKAFLVRDPKMWSWSSARFRDEYHRLQL